MEENHGHLPSVCFYKNVKHWCVVIKFLVIAVCFILLLIDLSIILEIVFILSTNKFIFLFKSFSGKNQGK